MAKLKGGTRIYGDIKIDGGIYDSSNQVGAAGSVLLSTGIGISWGTLSFATYATSSGIATYATSSGIATYATSSGVSTSVIGGIGSITQLQVTGISTFTNGPVFIGTATSTGTSGQVLQVAGINSSVYIGGNLGIGTTNPTSKLHIVGDVRVTGVVTASSFSGNASSATYATSSGIATYATSAGIATYATSSGIATYATSSGIATYATSSGVSTSVIGGIGSITQLQVTGISTFTNGPVLIGTATSTGTSGQVLQVAGINSSVYIGGNLGIGTTNPTSKLHIVGVVTATAYYGDGSNLSGIAAGISILDNTTTNSTFYVGITSTLSGSLNTLNVSSTKLTFNPSTGNLVAGGTVTANSDKKLKTNIRTIDNALEKVLSLRGVEFDRIDTGEHQIGVIAQEVENIIPEVVYPKNPSPNYETKSVAYANLVGLLIEAIKEQNIRIEELERRLGEV